jgi:hypothetical protein
MSNPACSYSESPPIFNINLDFVPSKFLVVSVKAVLAKIPVIQSLRGCWEKNCGREYTSEIYSIYALEGGVEKSGSERRERRSSHREEERYR